MNSALRYVKSARYQDNLRSVTQVVRNSGLEGEHWFWLNSLKMGVITSRLC